MMQTLERRRTERRAFERRCGGALAEINASGIYLCDFCKHDAFTRKDDISHHFQSIFHSLARILMQLSDLIAELISKLVAPENYKKSVSTASCSPPLIKVHWSEYCYEYVHLLGEILGLILTVAGGIAFAAVAFCMAVFPGSQPESMHEKLEREYRKKKQQDDEQRREDDVAYEVQQLTKDLRPSPNTGRPGDDERLREHDRRQAEVLGSANQLRHGHASLNDFDKIWEGYRQYDEDRWDQAHDDDERKRQK